jgi:thiamine pyrophosphokinase
MIDTKIISIIGNGEIPTQALTKLISEADLIIGADGGANILSTMDVLPNYIIGDLDSISEAALKKNLSSQIIHITDQNTTDLEKAVNFAMEYKPAEIRIFSALGNRSDHAIYNLFFLRSVNYAGTIKTYDNQGYWQIFRAGTHLLKGDKNEIISFFSFDEILALQVEGTKFNIRNGDYTDPFFSLSNVFSSYYIKLQFRVGTIFVYRFL